jgi:phage-related protein
MRGFGGGSIVEIIAHHRGDTWRAVYTVRFAEAIYVLHAFQKKSKRGIDHNQAGHRTDPAAFGGSRATASKRQN